MDTPEHVEEITARFREGPALLESALKGLREHELDTQPVNGGWSIRQIVHHIADGDDLWKICIKAAMGKTRPEYAFTWYWDLPQKDWADRWDYAHRPIDVSLTLLKACREHVLQLLETVPDAWQQIAVIPTPDGQTETLSVGAVVEMQADHVAHHVERINAIRTEFSK